MNFKRFKAFFIAYELNCRIVRNKFILLALLPFGAFAQIEDWYGVDLSRFGYKHNTYIFEQQKFEYVTNNVMQSKNDYLLTSFDPLDVRGSSFELSADVYSKHALFNIDASSLLDVGFTLFQFKAKERWWNNSMYRVNYSDILPLRLAFGTRDFFDHFSESRAKITLCLML